jgi:hypothetical protein
MTNDDPEIIIDDLWTKLFALHIGCKCPNERVKEKFINFILTLKNDQAPDNHLTEEFVFSQFPKFINYLAEY